MFCVSTAVQFLFWGIIFRRLAFFPKTAARAAPDEQPFVSVIICARNEAENLKKNLCHFLNQKYRSFEVVVVNDNSTDCTRKVVLDSMAKWPNLRLVDIVYDTPPGKKAALAKGIEAARGNYFLLSDADCRPASDEWIAAMSEHTNTILQIGLGFSPYDRERGFLNLFIRYETAYTAVQYFSLALWGMPYMGVGRNLMYNRSLYEQAGGFGRHAHIASGDDDLFVNAAATPKNATVILDERSFVYSLPEKTLRGYYNQKKRHVSTGSSYRPAHKFVLGLLSASHFLHYTAGAACILCGAGAPWVLTAAAARWVLLAARWKRILALLKQPDIRPWTLVLDVLFLGYYLVLAPALFVGKKNRWI